VTEQPQPSGGAVRQGGAGEPDGFERLWTPHRLTYIREGGGESAGQPCPFCRIQSGPDADGLVVARGELGYVVLNLYPYNPGHLMVCPYRHVPLYSDLTTAEVAEVGAFTQQAMAVLTAVSGAQGFNVGMNQGSVGGAGIAEHLHQHIVPRWGGDTNFMPVVGHVKVLPQLLGDTRDLLAAAWPSPVGQ
jgi:ATP adenylyltransferase